MKWYTKDIKSIEAALHTDRQKGITWKEAHKRLEKVGQNQIQDQSSISAFALLLNQFKDFMILILLIATLISGLLGEYIDAITIIAIIVLNAILGFVQEYKAEKSLHALKELTAPSAHVIREGVLQEIPAAELVPGDVVYFEAGDRIPADLRLFEAKGVYIEESALTGESVPVHKDTGLLVTEQEVSLGDQANMAFMGTLVTRGSGQGIVIGTGMATQMGQIAELIQTTETMQTPLQNRLEQLGKVLITVAIVLTMIVVFTGIWHGHDTYKMFLAGVSLAVAAIPEGLPAVVTIALALGVQRMIKRKAIVRKLPSVETLGCASVICSDKTGTLTQNKMTVTHLYVNEEIIEITGVGYEPTGEFLSAQGQAISFVQKPYVKKMLEYGVLCNNAALIEEAEREGKLLKRKKLIKLQQTLEDSAKADMYKLHGELLTAYMHQAKRGDSSIQVVNYYSEEGAMIEIPLNPELTPNENAQHFFKLYQKAKNSKEAVLEQMELTKQELSYFEQLQQQIEHASPRDIQEIREELIEEGYIRDRRKQKKKKKKDEKPQLDEYLSAEGIQILVGKNNKQNEYLTNRLAKANDTWLHTKDIPGSHVVIRSAQFNEQTLLEAAQLAAYFSKARSSSQVPVDYTLIKHVKKPNGSKPGYVTYDNQQTVFVTPTEEQVNALKK